MMELRGHRKEEDDLLTYKFSGADGVMTVAETLTSGMVGKQVKLEFTSDWDNLTKTAVFEAGDISEAVYNVGNTVAIPAAVLAIARRRLKIGIYGEGTEGNITPTIYAIGPRIEEGADPWRAAAGESPMPKWKELEERIEDLENGTTGGGSGSDSGQNPAGGGLSATATALLISILRNAMYTADQSANITALEAALASGGGGTDEPDTPVEPGVTYYTIVNVLTNVTNSNSAAKVSEGESYTATLTPADGFNMSTVTVTMGGVNVTADVYADGTITIERVTGNVIITASAVEDSATAPAFELTSPLVLGDTTDPRINDTANNRIATGETVNDDEDWTICIDFTSLNVPIVTNSTIYRNQNNQVNMGYSAPNWTINHHGTGPRVNDYGGKVEGVMHYAGTNMVVVATWDSVNKTYQTYGTTEYTKTYDSITTASSGQLSIGNADAIGTVNRFALYKRVLSADEITAWIGG